MKYVTPQNGTESEGHYAPSDGARTAPERVLELAAVLDPAAFDDDVPKSETQVAQIQWTARRHLAMESAGRAVAAGWVSAGDVDHVVFEAIDRLDSALDRAEDAEGMLELMVRPRAWFYKPGAWLRAWPISFGSDEFCRRTLVLGNWLTGCIVIALWQLNDPECPDCVELREA